MRENVILLLFQLLLILLSHDASQAEVIEVVAPPLRVNPKNSEDLELCYSVKVPDGKASEAVFTILHFLRNLRTSPIS